MMLHIALTSFDLWFYPKTGGISNQSLSFVARLSRRRFSSMEAPWMLNSWISCLFGTPAGKKNIRFIQFKKSATFNCDANLISIKLLLIYIYIYIRRNNLHYNGTPSTALSRAYANDLFSVFFKSPKPDYPSCLVKACQGVSPRIWPSGISTKGPRRLTSNDDTGSPSTLWSLNLIDTFFKSFLHFPGNYTNQVLKCG